MNPTMLRMSLMAIGLALLDGCDAKKDTVDKGREAVKAVVTQPFKTLDSAKDSLKQSEAKEKAALEEAAKEFK